MAEKKRISFIIDKDLAYKLKEKALKKETTQTQLIIEGIQKILKE